MSNALTTRAPVAAVVISIAVVAAGCGAHSVAPTAQPAPETRPARSVAKSTLEPPVSTPAVGSTSSSQPSPAGGPVPTGFTPASYTAVSDDTFWLLGTAPCTVKPCTSIVRTTDGGEHFVGTPAPKAPLSTKGVTQLRYADDSDGYAFGPQLWVTHDGGQEWTKLHVGSVSELAISDGIAFATVTTKSGFVLMKSAVSGNTWSVVRTPSQVSDGLWVQGGNIFVQSATDGGGIGASLLVSLDGGERWSTYDAPQQFPCIFDQVTAPVLWEKCASGMESSVWVSDNDGKTFRDPPMDGKASFVNGALFAAASNTVAVVADEDGYLNRTTNGGRSYTQVRGTGIVTWRYIGFTDPSHGVAIGKPEHGHNELFVTNDGGATWKQLTIS